MKKNQFAFFNGILLIFLMFTYTLFAQESVNKKHFTPHSGQEGKDVVWVPTPQILVDKMLDMANVTSSDYVMDLGSGDGRLVISAAKRGARALGIEYNPDMVALARENAKQEGVSDKAKFLEADIFETDFSNASVITLFLLTDLNIRLRPKLLELKPGTRIVSNTFTMGEWEADKSEVLYEDCDGWCHALLWVVPAKVDGKWKLDQGELSLSQEFQMISGKLKTSGKSESITEGRLNGNEINFRIGNIKYTGKVTGNKMYGTYFLDGKNINWSATR